MTPTLSGARFHRPRGQRHHRLKGQWRRDARQVRGAARELPGHLVDAATFAVTFGGYLLIRFLVLGASIGVIVLVMGAGR